MATATLTIGNITPATVTISNAKAGELVANYLKRHAKPGEVPENATQAQKVAWVWRHLMKRFRDEANYQASVDAG